MAHAAPAILASTLLATESAPKQGPRTVGTGCLAIDVEALDGGFEYGAVTAISGDQGTGKTLISLHTITTHLLHHPTSYAAIIDTSGRLDLGILQALVIHRLECLSASHGLQDGKKRVRKSREEILEQAGELLERVLVMRVFDFAGVVEAVGEVGGRLERRRRGGAGVGVGSGRGIVGRGDGKEKMDGDEAMVEEIADSEDEDEGDDDDDELGVRRAPGRDPNAISGHEEPGVQAEENDGDGSNIGVVVIDSITNVLSPIMTRNQTEGHGLLHTFTRSLRHLSSTYDLCTLLLNSTIQPRHPNPYTTPHSSSRAEHEAQYLRQQQQRRQYDDEQVSVFSDVEGKPALGKTFGYCVDVHVFLSRVERGDGVKVGVCEVIKDRKGGREGMWGSWWVDGVEMRNAL